MAGSARNSTSTLAASAAPCGPSPSGPLTRATRPDATPPETPGPRSDGDKKESKGYPVRRHKPHHSRSTLPPAISSPRCRCLQEHTRSQPTAPACFPASLPSAERPATRDEGGGEAPRDGAARCL